VVAIDASPETRSPPEAVSSRGKYEFVTLEQHYKTLQGLLEKWIKLTADKITEVENIQNQEVNFNPYLSEGDTIADKLENQGDSNNLHAILSQWKLLKLRLAAYDNLERMDGVSRERALKDLRFFYAFLTSFYEREREKRMEDLSSAVWNSFEAFKDSHLRGENLSEKQKKMLREKLQKNLKDWMGTFKKLEDPKLNEWVEKNKLNEKLDSVGKNGEKASESELSQMEQELSQGMGLWEQAMVQKEQENLAKTKNTLQKVIETIKDVIERELEVRKATESLKADSSEMPWKTLEEGQDNLAKDMKPVIEFADKELEQHPMLQMQVQELLKKSTGFMENASKNLGQKDWQASIQNENEALKTLMSGSKQMRQMMKQLGKNPQYSRGSPRRKNNYFKKTLNGPFEGPREYRDALRRNLREEKDSPLNQKEHQLLYQRLIK